MKNLVFRAYSKVFALVFGTRVARLLWKIPGSRAVYRAIMARLAPAEVELDGHRIALDPTDSLLLSVWGDYEQFERGVFSRCIRSGDVVVDIGAHIGLYTLTAAKAVGPAGRVQAFEPMSANFDLLSRNVAANGYDDRVRLNNVAVSDATGEAILGISLDNSGDNSLTVVRDAGESVRTVLLDDVLGEDCHIDVLKMDIQGGEPAALAGATASLAANENVILFCEVSPGHLAGGVGTYMDLLVSSGFELFELDESRGTLSATTPAQVQNLGQGTGSVDVHSNLAAAKGSQALERLLAAAGQVTGS